jgi:hypothetical protein
MFLIWIDGATNCNSYRKTFALALERALYVRAVHRTRKPIVLTDADGTPLVVLHHKRLR